VPSLSLASETVLISSISGVTYEMTSSAHYNQVGITYDRYQKLGSGLYSEFPLASVDLYGNGGGSANYVDIECYYDVGYSQPCFVQWDQSYGRSIPTAIEHNYLFNSTTTPHYFNPNYYYALKIHSLTGGYQYGEKTLDLFTVGSSSCSDLVSFCNAGGGGTIQDFFFRVNVDNSGEDDTTRLVEIYYPVLDSMISTTTGQFYFSGQVYLNTVTDPLVDSVRLTATNLDSGVEFTSWCAITGSGLQTVSCFRPASDGQYYMKVELTGLDGMVITGSSVTFVVNETHIIDENWFSSQATSSTSTVAYIEDACVTVSSSFTEALCVAFSFLFLPDETIRSSFFSGSTVYYNRGVFRNVGQMNQIIGGVVATTTDNMPSYVFNLHDLGIGSTTPIGNIMPNLTVLGAQSLQTYVPLETWHLLRSLAGLALQLTMIWFIYWSVVHFKY